MSNHDNKIPSSRPNLLKIAEALGGGYVLCKLFPKKKNLEQIKKKKNRKADFTVVECMCKCKNNYK